MPDSTPAVARGVFFLNADRREAWERVQRIAREHTQDEDDARGLLSRASLLAAEQLLARRATHDGR